MRCGLMESHGLRGECGTNSCLYWNLLGEGEKKHYQCALDYFDLVGPRRDRLSKWLLQLKIKTRAHLDTHRGSDPYASSARLRASEWSTSGAGYPLPASRRDSAETGSRASHG